MPRKPASLRQNRVTKDLDVLSGEVVAGSFGAPRPDPSPGWLEVVQSEWVDLWESDLASQIKDTDQPAVRRLFDWRDKQRRSDIRATALMDLALESPMVNGSKGQPVASPMFAAADSARQEALSIETRIVALEDRLGLSPKARLNLGVSEQKGYSLAAQNAQIAMALKEAMAGATDPRAVERDAAIDVG